MSQKMTSLNRSHHDNEFSFDTSAIPFDFHVKDVLRESHDQVFEYPWWTVDHFETEDFETACHKEVIDFVNWLSPTPEEIKMRDDVAARIKAVVHDLWPMARVELFGSYVTDLCVPTSDIDIVIFDTGCDRLEAIFSLSRELEKRHICEEPEVITWAKVPIIKLKDLRSGGCLVDISFDVHNGLQNTFIIKQFMEEYPLVRPLSLVLKYFLKHKYLNDTWNGGIGSYTLVLMIISFIQLHVSDDTEEVNLAQLLIEFFNLYGTKFDYITQVISVLEGKYIKKESKNWHNDSNPELLSIEDPHNPDVDVGTLSFKISQARNVFQEAYEKLSKFPTLCKSKNGKSFISQLIYLSYYNYDMRFRETVKKKYGDCFTRQKPIFTTSKNYSPNTRRRRKKGELTTYCSELPPFDDPERADLQETDFPPLKTLQ